MNSISLKFTALFILMCTYAGAQSESVILIPTEGAVLSCDTLTSSFIIQGTSSLHDWEMTSQSCKGSLRMENDGQSLGIENIQLKVGVTSLDSGNSIMDKKCYDALEHEDFPNIIYKLTRIDNIKNQGANMYDAVLTGTLNIAGSTQTVKINVAIQTGTDKINITGSKPLKMSDFGITPPKALLGTLKTGNDITINFNLNFIK